MAREFAKAFYNSKEWQNTRKYILMRDKYLCVKCGAPAEEVHHIKHLSPSNITDTEITMNPENLASLCRDCHFAEHKADKIRGIKQSHNIMDCDIQYEFDENGYLVISPH
jgi:5-methylcytosine-specific restriction endonuclease McrA